MANILTISIGSMSIKLCEVSYSGNSIHLQKAAVIRTPEDSVEDGFIKDELAVIDAIQQSLTVNKFEAKTAIFTIFSSRIASKEITAPDVKDNKLTQLITANAGDYFPVNIDEYIITHKTLEQIGAGKEKQLRVLVLAAPKEIVMSCYSIGYKLGLYVERVDYAGNSAVQVAKREIGAETTLVVQIQEDNSTINILKNNVLQLQRIVPYGKSMVVQTIVEEKGIDEYEAEEMLGTEELIHDHFDDDPITNSLRYLTNNIGRVVEYYVSRHDGDRIEKAYITGASAEMLGMEQLFVNEFDFPVMETLPMHNVVATGTLMLTERVMPRFIANLGAGISPADFIPNEEIEKVNKEVDFKLLNLLLFGSVMVAIVIIAIPMIQYMTAKSQRDSMQEKVNEIIEVEAVMNDYYNAKDKLGDIQNFYALTENADDSMGKFIKDMETYMPADSAVTALSIAAGSVNFNITAASKESVAKFIIQLKNLDYVSDVVAGALSESEDTSGVKTVNYTLTCTFTKVAEE